MFSNIELKVIKQLGNKKLKISELAIRFFKIHGGNPIDINAVISSAILRINKKCKYHKLPWVIEGEGLGRNGRTVWKKKA